MDERMYQVLGGPRVWGQRGVAPSRGRGPPFALTHRVDAVLSLSEEVPCRELEEQSRCTWNCHHACFMNGGADAGGPATRGLGRVCFPHGFILRV